MTCKAQNNATATALPAMQFLVSVCNKKCEVLLPLNLLRLSVCYYHVMYNFQSESTLYSLPGSQRTPCSRQVPYLKFKWQQQDSNPEPLNL